MATNRKPRIDRGDPPPRAEDMICAAEAQTRTEALQIGQRTKIPPLAISSPRGTTWLFLSEKPQKGFAPVRLERTEADIDPLAVVTTIDGKPHPAPLQRCWRVGAYLLLIAEVSEQIVEQKIDVVSPDDYNVILDVARSQRNRAVRFTAHEVSARTEFKPKVFVTDGGREFKQLTIGEVPYSFVRACHEAASKLYLRTSMRRMDGEEDGVNDNLRWLAEFAGVATHTAPKKDVEAPPKLRKRRRKKRPVKEHPAPVEVVEQQPEAAPTPKKKRRRGGLKWKLRLARAALREGEANGITGGQLAALYEAVDAAEKAVVEKFGEGAIRKPEPKAITLDGNITMYRRMLKADLLAAMRAAGLVADSKSTRATLLLTVREHLK